jgi:DNA repair exonuclease SbcCD ATPase subunit
LLVICFQLDWLQFRPFTDHKSVGIGINMSGIILPRIRRVASSGFEPIYTDGHLNLTLPPGPFVVLGGNGLGKTTTLQTVVFALAGDVGSDIEEKTEFQWGVSFFKNRLNNSQDAEAEVEFSLGDTVITVRRRMNSKTIRGVKIANKDWIHDSALATEEYEKTVCKAGAYDTFDDFRYLTHRLCYLDESRRSLVWDQGAQLRAVMMICGDTEMEHDFRRLRSLFKETDSELRHTHVDIGALEKRLAQVTASAKSSPTDENAGDSIQLAITQTAELEAELLPLSTKRLKLRDQLVHGRKSLISINSDLETLQTRYNQLEDAFVLKTLRKMEDTSSALALHKLLVHELCPYCTQKAVALATQARVSVSQGKCPICGQQHSANGSDKEIVELRLGITAKTKEQDEFLQIIEKLEDEEAQLIAREIAIKNRLQILITKLPRVQFAEVSGLVGSNPNELRARLRTTKTHYARLEVSKKNLEQEMDEKYKSFSSLCARRLTQLAALAGEYGSRFLGAPCKFVMTPSRERLNLFSFFVPEFEDKKREVPESCSESERFFLDIAFRMAVIMFAGLLSKTRSTFICETPENALDLAYTENVASMFHKFSNDKFSLLLTANLQLGGVAKPLLDVYPKREKLKRVLNLIEKCPLSDVQAKRRKGFMREYRRIIG